MKKSTIEDIFYGRRREGEKINKSKKYRKLMNQNSELIENFKKDLTNEQIELLIKIENLSAELDLETALNCFTEGFKLGLEIGIECTEE